MELRRQDKWQGLETLQLIREELLSPFKNLRPPYQPLSCVVVPSRLARRCLTADAAADVDVSVALGRGHPSVPIALSCPASTSCSRS